ncbi:MAG: DUF2207 domain-containing protein [Patescibacteria group bacterium]
MKRIFHLGGLIAFFLFIPNISLAQNVGAPTGAGQLYGWDIVDYQTEIAVRTTGEFEVTENILTDFYQLKHGIFRYIPLKYKVGGIFNYYLGIDLIGIYRQDGAEWDYQQTKSGKFWEYKIGSPDQTIQGRQLYKIKYNVKRGIRYFGDHDELYWNVTGTDWEVPRQNVGAVVSLPKEVSENELKFACYTGFEGSTEQNCNYLYDPSENSVTFTSVEKDPAQNYLTIAVWLPKGYLIEPSLPMKVWYFIGDNYVLFLPILICATMFFIWRKKGKDPKSNKPIVAQYDACDLLTPGLVGVIEKERPFNAHDLPAEIVLLATMRILKIKEVDAEKKKYQLIKRRDWQGNSKVTSYQTYLLEKLFPRGQTEIDLDELKNNFSHTDSVQFKMLADAHIKAQGYYQTSVAAKGAIVGIGALLLMLSVIWAAASQSGLNFFIGALCAVIVIVFGIFMPKKTPAGIEMLNYIKGLKEYINVAEKDRIKDEEAANIFSKVLPFAMVMGLTDKWVTLFSGILKEPPEWLEVSDLKAFSGAYLAGALTRFENQTNSGFAPAYRSGGSAGSSGFSSGGSGGGSSGGGFGGGGGGSW